MNKALSLSLGLVDQFATDGSSISAQIKSKVNHEFASLPTKILGEYFSKSDVSRTLFSVAKDLEVSAMSRVFNSYSDSSSELKSFIGCLLDYWSIDRLDFSSSAKSA
ncbi:hypothetical protein [Endozoicomonas montiporae]|uniref:Uncharacterized protein n=1 Tax=Endozoicomonas montiporae CL-33 TaxID=570277 RepID=A0A142B871_9GAMM|nr:hypothetical protein [Endozoicomonas montiporae]AMO54947.1 hypothetical protein EZMO1_0711 [Endozoicomonas montiporae CL-33]